MSFPSDNKFCLDIQRIEITSDIPEDPTVKLTVDKFVGELFYCLYFAFLNMCHNKVNNKSILICC